ncbi:MAG: hypothetical protein C7B43_09200 [Sulfobacillus benefaciens]|uniref:Uncharacterized protein n=1 Tax=Sulfobacillus benefaciens TaxID=453960 RepID=A0A2T2X2Z6_9FIRM|nr:MAG: hypothetical protein C7B43_09200 [Sulfobacillus benefaciens]
MEDVVASGAKFKRVPNEAIFLYDMDADDVFLSLGYVVIDSSLGLVAPRAGMAGAEARPSPSTKPVH